MKVSVSLNFKKYAEDKFFTYGDGVVLGMTTDPRFASYKAEVEVAKTLLADYKNHTIDPNAGGALYYAQKASKKEATTGQFELLAKLMDIFAKGDITIILASGHEVNTGVSRTSNNFGAPTSFTISKGERGGSALLKWKGEASHYNIEWRIQGQDTWIGGNSSGLKSFTIYNFALRSVIEFRIQAVSKDGVKSDWTVPVEYWVTT